MSKLRAELQGDDYKVKLGGLVSQLYKLAFQTYHDIPRGPIKVENSARWFMVLGVDDGDGDRHSDDVDHVGDGADN